MTRLFPFLRFRFPSDVEDELDRLADQAAKADEPAVKRRSTEAFRQLVREHIGRAWDYYQIILENKGFLELRSIEAHLIDSVQFAKSYLDSPESYDDADARSEWEEARYVLSIVQHLIHTYAAGHMPKDFETEFFTRLSSDEKEIEELRRQLQLKDNQLLVTTRKVKALTLKTGVPTRSEMVGLIDRNRHKSSERANCAAIGRALGRHRDTVDRWIRHLGLSDYARLPT